MLWIAKLGINGIGFLLTYFSVGDYKIYPVGFLIGVVLILGSIIIPDNMKRVVKVTS